MRRISQLPYGLDPHSLAYCSALSRQVGSFVLGAITASSSLPPRTKLLFGTGLCGAFTTYSTFAVDFVKMTQAREMGKAAAYLGASNGLSIGAAMAGFQTVARRVPK